MDNFEEKPIGVYIKTGVNNYVIEVNSDAFISNLNGWSKIDEGYGDKYSHAQSQYFDKPLINEDGLYNYQFINNKVVEV